MQDSFFAIPGRIYVVATLLPMAAFALLLVAGLLRRLCPGGWLYRLLGGDTPGRSAAYLVLLAMAASAIFSLIGLARFLSDPSPGHHQADSTAEATHLTQATPSRWAERVDWFRLGWQDSIPPEDFERRRQENPDVAIPRLALALELGYRIDHLTALLFAMVGVVGTAIILFSIGYMQEELQSTVEDHEVPHQTPTIAHFHRRGRYGRFFLYMALFCFSMFNLLIADNLFQVFVSWELVGVCSFFLIGFYYERPSAGFAANKAFIMNRVGDAGFLIALMIAWSSLGTLNIEEMIHRVRSPMKDSHGQLELGGQLVRVQPVASPSAMEAGERVYRLPGTDAAVGSHLALFPLAWPEAEHFHGLGFQRHNEKEIRVPASPGYTDFGAMPYWLFVVMGVGLFLGCVGKSAQFPLHTWLPDAMEGPTPVSALIHAATMVAAGVYLVGRCYPLLAPEVLLGIAYVGALTMVLAATIALVMTDIKRILAYSTVSQLGMMMLALGVGGWVAGLLHLLTHAFFKALLFLGSGSVIHGCHHEQDLRRMGGLGAKMPLTAATMLIGVLAIAGIPFFSGWYSKDLILQSALGYGLTHPEHLALFLLPVLTAGLTAFYMFRLWFLTFTGQPRDPALYEHVHESPAVMTLPLVLLAACSVGVAWGWPVWQAEASGLARVLHHAEPPVVNASFAQEHEAGHHWHWGVAGLALLMAFCGAALAARIYWKPRQQPAIGETPPGTLSAVFAHKWYFDELYDAAFTQPTVALARYAGAIDKRPTDGSLRPERFDGTTLDGMLNTLGDLTESAGNSLRQVQTGQLRNYILFLALTTTAMLGILLVLKG